MLFEWVVQTYLKLACVFEALRCSTSQASQAGCRLLSADGLLVLTVCLDLARTGLESSRDIEWKEERASQAG